MPKYQVQIIGYEKLPQKSSFKNCEGACWSYCLYVKQKELDITGFNQLPKEQWPLADLLFSNNDFNQFVTKSVRDVFDTVCPTALFIFIGKTTISNKEQENIYILKMLTLIGLVINIITYQIICLKILT